MDVVTLLADRLQLHDVMRAPQQRIADDANEVPTHRCVFPSTVLPPARTVDDRDSGTASDDESAAGNGDIVDMLMLHSLTAAAAAAAAAQRQQNSTSLPHVTTTEECSRSSFSGQPCVSSTLLASAGQTTFRPVVAAAARSLYCTDRLSAMAEMVGACPPASSCDRRRVLTPDDASSSNPATRKRRHGGAPYHDVVMSSAASDDDEEIRTIFCDEATMTSRAPVMTSEKRHCAAPQSLPRQATTASAVVNDCSVTQRPSLNFYKMQRMRIGRRLSLMQRHSPLGRPRPLAALQSSLNASHYGASDAYDLRNNGADVPAYYFRSLTTPRKRTCVDSRRPVCSVGATYATSVSMSLSEWA